MGDRSVHRRAVVDPWPLLGRSEELTKFRDLFRTDANGIMLAGAAGVGKTRLALKCVDLAEEAGASAVRINATRASRPIPLGAFTPLMPTVHHGESAGVDDRADLLRQCERTLVASAANSRLVLLVDDAHLLDDTSATLVHQMTSTGTAFLVATVRSGEPSPDSILALWKDQVVDRLDVAEVDTDTVEELLVTVLGDPVDRATTSSLTVASQGNILFLRELVLGALHQNTLRKDIGLWRLVAPPSPSSRLTELLKARLEGLCQTERDLMEIMAFGEPLGAAELEALGDPAVVEDLERKGLLSSSLDGRRLQVRLAHPLYGDVLREETPPLRVRKIVRALAEAVEATGARRREDALRVATWRLESGGGNPDLLLAAATTARWRYDFALAERLVNAALQAGAGFDAELLASQLAFLQGRPEEADARLITLMKNATDDRQRALTAITRIDNHVFLTGHSDEGRRMAEETEATVEDPIWRDEIAAKRVAMIAAVQGPKAAAEFAEPLLKRATGRAFVWAAIPSSFALGRLGRFSEASEVADRGQAVHLALAEPLEWYPWTHTFFHGEVLAHAGRLDDAYALADEEYQQSVSDRSPEAQAWFAWQLCKSVGERGYPRTAAIYGRTAVALFRQLGRPQFEHFALGHLSLVLALEGDAREARKALDALESLQLPPALYWAGDVLQARAWAAVAEGDIEQAWPLLEEAVTLGEKIGDHVAESAALHALARLGRPGDVVGRLAALSKSIDGVLARVRADHARALTDDDAASLEAASQEFEHMGAQLLAAEAAADASVAWQRSTGDARHSTKAENRAIMLARRCENPCTPPLQGLTSRAQLTRAERQVALLAATGRTNKDIANQLVVSRRTVENHLQRVYEKLGVSSRTELSDALESLT